MSESVTVTAPAVEGLPADAEKSRQRKVVRVVITILISTISLLIAYTAWQSSQYADESAALSAAAARLSVESIRTGQEDRALHTQDFILWMQLRELQSTLEPSTAVSRAEIEAVKRLMSEPFRDAVGRQEAREEQGLSATGLPMDDRYWAELSVSADAAAYDLTSIYARSRIAGATAARQTGATVVYSAALVLLTVAGTVRGKRNRWLLCAGATGLAAVAFSVALAELRF